MSSQISNRERLNCNPELTRLGEGRMPHRALLLCVATPDTVEKIPAIMAATNLLYATHGDETGVDRFAE
jgi:hypothetical protein